MIATLRSLLDGYGALFLARRRLVGALVLVATLCDPATGLCGLAAGGAALASRKLLRLPSLPGEADILNAIYAGLALGAFYGGEPRVLTLAAFGGLFTVLLATALQQVLAGPLGTRRLPLLGAPFLGAAWTLLATASALALPLRVQWPAWPEWLPAAASAALAHVGALFYVAHPVAGILVLAALLLASRVLTLLAIAGALLAPAFLSLIGTTPTPGLGMLAAFNGALVAIFVGGILAAPTRRTLLVAGGGVLVASALSAGMLALATPFGIPPLSAPFVLTVWMAHAALRADTSAWWSRFWLAVPASPEESLVNTRLANARGMASGSVALLPPYPGRMTVSQAVDGALTHQGPWRYAFDFVRIYAGMSYQRDGDELSDFHAFNRPVLSPTHGRIAACCSDVADNPPGALNLVDNWGNHVLIDIGGGLYVLLAHLRQGSVEVTPGQTVRPGDMLGRCGNSGRSTQPHLHLHVQRGAKLGSPTVPCHLTHCLIDSHEYTLDGRPGEGQTVADARSAAAISRACAHTPGGEWRFQAGAGEWRLAAETGLLGETSLVSSGGGRVLTTHASSLLALHQRRGAPDILLDAFVLAFGMTPFSAQAMSWHDAADASLLSLPRWSRLALRLRHPFGTNLKSHYQRRWDAERSLWQQRSSHRVTTALGEIECKSVGWLSEVRGPVAFSLVFAGQTIAEAALVGYGNRGDHGVPAKSANFLQPATS